MEKLLNIKDIQEIFGVSRQTIYNMIKSNSFPKPMKYTNRVMRWKKSEIDKYLEKGCIEK